MTASSRWLGPARDVSTAARRSRESLVLKVPTTSGETGSPVGRAVGEDHWLSRVDEVTQQDGVVQQYVEPTEVPVVTGAPARMACSLDWFVIDGHVVGLGSKASSGPLLNLFQGGTKLAVFQESGS